MRKALLCGVLSLAFVLGRPVAASAQPEPVQDSTRAEAPAGFAAAREAYLVGWRLKRQGRCAQAVPQFERSNALRPSTAAWHDLAECHQLLGNVESSCDASRRVLWESSEPPGLPASSPKAMERYRQAVAERVGQARTRMDELRCAKARLQLSLPEGSSAPIARVSLDGSVVALPLPSGGLPIEPGKYELVVERVGASPWSQRLEVRAEPRQLELRLPRVQVAGEPAITDSEASHDAGPSARRRRPRWRSPAVLTAAGLTLAAGAGWVASDRRFASRWERYQQETDAARRRDAYDQAAGVRPWGTGFALATGVGLVSTLALYFLVGGDEPVDGAHTAGESPRSAQGAGAASDPSRYRTRLAFTPLAWMGESGAGVAVLGAF